MSQGTHCAGELTLPFSFSGLPPAAFHLPAPSSPGGYYYYYSSLGPTANLLHTQPKHCRRRGRMEGRKSKAAPLPSPS